MVLCTRYQLVWRKRLWSFSKFCVRKRCSSTVAFSKEEFLNYPLTNADNSNGPPATTKKLPSVSKILNESKSEKDALILLMWKRKMIKEMGEEAFQAMQKETLAVGSSCHSSIEEVLGGVPMESVRIAKKCENLWSSVSSTLREVSDVRVVERRVSHSALGYSGICDCVAKYRDTLCLIDWKTSKKPKKSLDHCYDYPLQVAAYTGAYNFTSSWENQISNGLLVVMYHNGEPCTTLSMNEFTLHYYWRRWLERLWIFKTMADDVGDENVSASATKPKFQPDLWM